MLWDWERMAFGQTPPIFLLEVAIRLAVIFVILLVAMRTLGSRMSARLSRTEMVAMVSLAAAIGTPLHSPDRGILPAIVVALVVVVVGRLAARISYLNPRAERMIQDDVNVLVKDAVLDINSLTQTRLTVERTFAQLRSSGIRHLGEVRRLYIEANGSFTLVRDDQPEPGLSIIPDLDPEFSAEQERTDKEVCAMCGCRGAAKQEGGDCNNCGRHEWTSAIK